MFEIRKNLDLGKILVTPKIFLKSRFHCSSKSSSVIDRLRGVFFIFVKSNTVRRSQR